MSGAHSLTLALSAMDGYNGNRSARRMVYYNCPLGRPLVPRLSVSAWCLLSLLHQQIIGLQIT